MADPDRTIAEPPAAERAPKASRCCRVERQAGRAGGPTPAPSAVPRPRRASTPEALALVVGRACYLRRAGPARPWPARRLRGAGVGPEVRVGIFLARGLELVVALLGSCGPAAPTCLSIPAYPGSAWRFMLEDCGAAAWCSRRAAGASACLPVVGLRTVVSDGEESPRRRPPPQAGPRLPDLHLRLDRAAQGGRHRARERRELIAWARRVFSDDGALRRRRRHLDQLRPVGLRDLRPLALGGAVILVDNALEIARLKERGGPGWSTPCRRRSPSFCAAAVCRLRS